MDTTPTRAPSSQNTTPEQTHGPASADSGGFSQGGQIGVLNKQPSVIMFTYTLKLGPHAHTACVKLGPPAHTSACVKPTPPCHCQLLV